MDFDQIIVPFIDQIVDSAEAGETFNDGSNFYSR